MTQQQQPVGQQYQQPTSQQFGGQSGTQQFGGGSQFQGQQPQYGQGTSQSFGQQPTGSTQQMGTGGQSMQFEEALPSELRLVLHDTNKLANVAEWTKNQVATQGPQMQEVVRIADDLAAIAELNEKLIARDSAFGMQISRTLIDVCQQALPQLKQYEQQQPEVRELSGVVRNLLDSIQKEMQIMGDGGSQQFGTTSGTGTPQYGQSQQY